MLSSTAMDDLPVVVKFVLQSVSDSEAFEVFITVVYCSHLIALLHVVVVVVVVVVAVATAVVVATVVVVAAVAVILTIPGPSPLQDLTAVVEVAGACSGALVVASGMTTSEPANKTPVDHRRCTWMTSWQWKEEDVEEDEGGEGKHKSQIVLTKDQQYARYEISHV